MSTPPLPGKGLSVKVDQELYDDLAVMMRTGMTASAAVKHAVSLIAETYRNAWLLGAVSDGSLPHITGCSVVPDQQAHTSHPARTPSNGEV